MTTRPSTPHDHINASVTHLIAIQYVLAIRTPTGNTASLETGVLSEYGASEIIGCTTINQQYNSMYVQCTCLLDMTVTFHSFLPSSCSLDVLWRSSLQIFICCWHPSCSCLAFVSSCFTPINSACEFPLASNNFFLWTGNKEHL